MPPKLRRVSSSASVPSPTDPSTFNHHLTFSHQPSTSSITAGWASNTSVLPQACQSIPSIQPPAVSSRRLVGLANAEGLNGSVGGGQAPPAILHRRVHHPSSLLRRNQQQVWMSSNNGGNSANTNNSCAEKGPLGPPGCVGGYFATTVGVREASEMLPGGVGASGAEMQVGCSSLQFVASSSSSSSSSSHMFSLSVRLW